MTPQMQETEHKPRRGRPPAPLTVARQVLAVKRKQRSEMDPRDRDKGDLVKWTENAANASRRLHRFLKRTTQHVIEGERGSRIEGTLTIEEAKKAISYAHKHCEEMLSWASGENQGFRL